MTFQRSNVSSVNDILYLGICTKKVYLTNSGIRIYTVAIIKLNQCRHISKTASDIFFFVRLLCCCYAGFCSCLIGLYWTKIQKKQKEPYLTFLNIPQLERQGADMQSKVEELEQLNQAIMNRDKLKDDAIAHLSDQLIALTARLDSIERRQ
jgi:hypothetical protein